MITKRLLFNRTIFLSLLIFLMYLLGGPQVIAAEKSDPANSVSRSTVEPQAGKPAGFLSLSLGYYDVNDNEEALDIRAEYRWRTPLLLKLKPFAGLEVSSEGALYGLGGLYMDYEIVKDFYFMPSFGAGLYSDGGGKNLGHTIQFRSQLEISYQLENSHRVSLAAAHISNADLDEDNPGTEIIGIYYHVPIDQF